jgi:hypothetical protein
MVESLVDKKIIDVPNEPGTVPIPNNHIRLYHYTTAPAEELRRDGLLLSKAKGHTYGEPDMIWSSLKMPGKYKRYVEFSVPIDDPRFSIKPDACLDGDHCSDFTFMGDIKPSEFIAINEPWHHTYRYLTKDPKYIEATLNGEFDHLSFERKPDEAEAVHAVKANYGQ